MAIIDGADGPPDDESREQIEDDPQVRLTALADPQLARVADPALIRPLRGELLRHQIVGHRLPGRSRYLRWAHRGRPSRRPGRALSGAKQEVVWT
jgi:hypothetical protein